MKILMSRNGLLLVATGLLTVVLLPGCGGTATNPSEQLNGNFSGLYSQSSAAVTTNADGTVASTIVSVASAMVTTNSGNPVMTFNLTQAQGTLRAVDNNGTVFTGTFKVAYANGGMIQMDGVTAAGTPVHIAGYLEASDSSAWMNASWIEPNLTGTMYGTAQVTPFSPTNPAVWRP